MNVFLLIFFSRSIEVLSFDEKSVGRFHYIGVDVNNSPVRSLLFNISGISIIFPSYENVTADVFTNRNSAFEHAGKIGKGTPYYGVHCGKAKCMLHVQSSGTGYMKFFTIVDTPKCNSTLFSTDPEINIEISSNVGATLPSISNYQICFYHAPSSKSTFKSKFSSLNDDNLVFYPDTQSKTDIVPDYVFGTDCAPISLFEYQTGNSNGQRKWEYYSKMAPNTIVGNNISFFYPYTSDLFFLNAHNKTEMGKPTYSKRTIFDFIPPTSRVRKVGSLDPHDNKNAKLSVGKISTLEKSTTNPKVPAESPKITLEATRPVVKLIPSRTNSLEPPPKTLEQTSKPVFLVETPSNSPTKIPIATPLPSQSVVVIPEATQTPEKTLEPTASEKPKGPVPVYNDPRHVKPTIEYKNNQRDLTFISSMFIVVGFPLFLFFAIASVMKICKSPRKATILDEADDSLLRPKTQEELFTIREEIDSPMFPETSEPRFNYELGNEPKFPALSN